MLDVFFQEYLDLDSCDLAHTSCHAVSFGGGYHSPSRKRRPVTLSPGWSRWSRPRVRFEPHKGANKRGEIRKLTRKDEILNEEMYYMLNAGLICMDTENEESEVTKLIEINKLRTKDASHLPRNVCTEFLLIYECHT